MKQCPVCQQYLELNALVCHHCHSQLKHCPRCGALLFHKSTFCTTCNSSLLDEAAPNSMEKRQQTAAALQVVGPPVPAANVRPSYTAPPPTYYVSPPRSFLWAAFLTFLLYYVGFWILGFIANLIFRGEARHERERTGQTPSGSGCLDLLFFVHVTLPLLLICFGAALLVFAPEMLYDLLDF